MAAITTTAIDIVMYSMKLLTSGLGLGVQKLI